MLVTMGEGGYGAFITFACFCLSMFIFVWFLVPETKGLALEKMDDLFGVTELVKKMDDEETGSIAASNEKTTATAEQVEISPATK